MSSAEMGIWWMGAAFPRMVTLVQFAFNPSLKLGLLLGSITPVAMIMSLGLMAGMYSGRMS